MRWFAVMFLFGAPQCFDRRVSGQLGPEYERDCGPRLHPQTCNKVFDVYERPNGARYTVESEVCLDKAVFSGGCG
jgi:hypothetical protein